MIFKFISILIIMKSISRGKTMRDQMMKGFEVAFIEKGKHASAYIPQFISNNNLIGKKVLTTIEEEMNQCEEFLISVAFITEGGITPLLQTLNQLQRKGIKGKILTSDYLTFSEPKALKKLQQFENIEIKMYQTNVARIGFHTKGYIFRKGDMYTFIVGSSNLTLSAITINKEWNSKLIASSQGEFSQTILGEFDQIWHQATSLDEVIEQYEKVYHQAKQQRKLQRPSIFAQVVTANSMQQSFVENMRKLREVTDRALLVSATGTGKTFAAAFALKDALPKRALFIVHREQIAKQAMKTFKRVFNESRTFGLISGNSKEVSQDFLFSTMQMMSKKEIHELFAPDYFEYIVIDEAHRVGATSYQRIMDYFKPKFLLGMSASPERTDSFDVFEAFGHQIAQEIRLQQALENDLLCPFQYFGITDIEVEGELLKETTDFSYLVSDQRVEHLIQKIEYYGYSGDRVKGLMFCRTNVEAKELARQLNLRGIRSVALCGSDSQEEREDVIDRLVNDKREDYLDYILTIDIFNEGVDIPEINQVIMLRPTQSPIIFVQQLGRGLRKSEGKEYVTILDFIGNYTNNFMIPVALSGDRSYNKDTIRKYVAEGTRVIPGSSTIHFDEIAKKKIYASIDTANFNTIKIIKESYLQLRYRLGRIPKMIEFLNLGELDLQRVFDNSNLGSYYKLLKRVEENYDIELNPIQENIITFLSTKLGNGKRIHELLLIELMINNSENLYNNWTEELRLRYGVEITHLTKENVLNIMTNNFATGTGKHTFQHSILIEEEGNEWKISKVFEESLSDENFKLMVTELVEYATQVYMRKYASRYLDTQLTLYEKYTYEDVCRLLEWQKGEVALNIGGYKYDKHTKTYPVFINYDKHEGVAATIAYEDRFISNRELIAISKSGRTLQSEDVQIAINAENLKVQMHLFVRKNKDDKVSKEFYYLGKINVEGTPHEIIMNNTNKKAVELPYTLHTAVREDVYDYIMNREDE